MSVTLGDAFVRVRPDTSGFQAEATGSLTSGFRKLAGLAAGLFAAAKVKDFLKESIGLSSDLNETVNKTDVIFDHSGRQVIRWSQNSATAFGLSQTAALGAASQFGNMFQQLGFTEKASRRASEGLVKTAADLGSFNNVDPSDVLNRIGGALRGEYDSLQQLIPNINAARVEQVAMARTGKDNAAALTAQEKAAAVLAIVHKDGAAAANDFAETSGGLANQQRIWAAQTDNLKAKIGDGLRPAVTSLMKTVNSEVLPPLIHLAGKYLPQVTKGFGDWASSLDFGAAMDQLRGFLASVKWSDVSSGAHQIGAAFQQMAPGLKDAGHDLPTLNDSLRVAGVVLRFAANHADLLAKALPYLVAGFLAVKVAQASANVVALASPVLKVADILVNRRLTASNKTLALSITQMTGSNIAAATSEGTNTAAKNGGVLASMRSRVATIAKAVAEKSSAAASKALAAAQWLVNAAMRANPIGLVITALVALGVGLVVLWKKSQTFRDIVTTALGWVVKGFKAFANGGISVTSAVIKAWGWMVDKILAGIGTILHGVAKMDALIPGDMQGMSDSFDRFRSGVANSINGAVGKLDGLHDKINAIPDNFHSDYKVNGVDQASSALNAYQAKLANLDGRTYTTTLALTGGGRPMGAGISGFARGGIAAGPDIGRDYIHALVRGGEGFLTPETTRKLGGLAGIDALNRWGKGGADVAVAITNRSSVASSVGNVGSTLQDYMHKAVTHAAEQAAGRWTKPLSNYVKTATWMSYPGHTGIDLAGPWGTPVRAAAAGRVTASYDIFGSNPYSNDGYASYGRLVKILHAGNIQTLYAHLQDRAVRDGQMVAAGQMIGRRGSHGNSSGSHTHYETRPGDSPVNPDPFMRARGVVLDSGGWMLPGTGGINLSRRPEAVLDPDESLGLKALAPHLADDATAGFDGPTTINIYDVDGVLMGSMRGEVVRDRKHRKARGRQMVTPR